MPILGLNKVMAVLLGGLLTASSMSVDHDIRINSDGSGRIVGTFEVDVAELEALGSLPGMSTEEACSEALADQQLLPGTIFGSDTSKRFEFSEEQTNNGDECSLTETLKWSKNQLETVMDILQPMGTKIMRLDNGGWRVEIDEIGEPEEIDGSHEHEEAMISDMDSPLPALPTFNAAITLPGEPVDHNAHHVEGSRFTWSFDLSQVILRNDLVLYAQTTPDDDGVSAETILLSVVFSIMGLVILWVAVRVLWSFFNLLRGKKPEGDTNPAG
ncbi:hypothetical protein [Candidatus Poriferisocius sp.]|uniref:hypothetical protein n=1 Tax=Candidatus Poriferisocius sp. TaxID=3101276 RepID=UPI003B0285D3